MSRLGWCWGFLAQVHYTAGEDGYVILNKDELPQELPFSVCNQSPPQVQVIATIENIFTDFNLNIKSVEPFNNQLLSKLLAHTPLAAMPPGLCIAQVIIFCNDNYTFVKNIIKDESSTVGTMNNEHEQWTMNMNNEHVYIYIYYIYWSNTLEQYNTK